MSEVSKQEIIGLIYQFAENNTDYRRALLADPKKVLEKQMQQNLPESLKVKVVQESADTVYLVAPYVPQQGDELSDEDLEKVAGGKGKGGGGGTTRNESNNMYICNDTKGIGTRVEVTTNVG